MCQRKRSFVGSPSESGLVMHMPKVPRRTSPRAEAVNIASGFVWCPGTMNTYYEPKFLPIASIPNKFACDRDSIFAAAADGRIKLWTYAEHWLDAISKAGIKERIDYVELAPQDAVPYRTSSSRSLSRAMVGDRVVIAGTAIDVPDGNLFVDAAQASKVFPLRPDPSALSPDDGSADDDDPSEEGLGDKEEENLWRTLGALALLVSESKPIFKHGDKPNANRIAQSVFDMLKAKSMNVNGLHLNSLEKRFAESVRKLARE